MNQFIRVPQVRLIGGDGSQMGVFATEGAIKIAQEEGLDLVEVDPHANPPVCKVMDYGKYRYQQQKKQHESRRHQVVIHVKEIKMRPNIDEHDLQFKLRHVRRFLTDKDKAKITIRFRGREMQHMDRARIMIDRILKDTADIGAIESPAKVEGKTLSMILMPK